MKKLLAIFGILAVTQMAMAGMKGNPFMSDDEEYGERYSSEERIERMTQHLGLTPEQVEKMTELMERSKEKRKELRAQMREMHMSDREAMKEILTEEQAEKMREHMEEKDCDRKGKHGKKHHH